MALRINTAHRDAQLNPRAAAFAGGFFDVYTGAQPASANDVATGTLLVSIELGNPAFNSVDANGIASLVTTFSEFAVASGQAGWGRLRNAADTRREDYAAGSEFTLDDVNIVAGGEVTLSFLNLTKSLG